MGKRILQTHACDDHTGADRQRFIETNLSRRLRPAGLGRLIFLRLTQYHQLDVKVYGNRGKAHYDHLVVWLPPELHLEV